MTVKVSKIQGWFGGGGNIPGDTICLLTFFDGKEFVDKTSDIPAQPSADGTYIKSIHGVDSNNVYAGVAGRVSYHYREAYIWFFNGTTWVRIANPALPTSDPSNNWSVNSIKHINENEVWFAMWREYSGFQGIVARWNKTSWDLEYQTHIWSLPDATTKLTILDNGEVYSVGRYIHKRNASTGVWVHEDLATYGGAVNNQYLDNDGSTIYLAQNTGQIWKGSFGSWTKILDLTYLHASAVSFSSINVFPNGDIYATAKYGILTLEWIHPQVGMLVIQQQL
jgi:hypothetical protein